MSGETTATSPDPEYGAEGDTNQLDAADTLVDRGGVDVLDEGYSPPERPRKNHWGETAWEECHHEPFAQRLAEEEPDTPTTTDTLRAGRIVPKVDVGQDGVRENDLYGDDAGIDGAGASAEEAAVHWTQEP